MLHLSFELIDVLHDFSSFVIKNHRSVRAETTIAVRSDGVNACVERGCEHLPVFTHQTIIPITVTVNKAIGHGHLLFALFVKRFGQVSHLNNLCEIARVDYIAVEVEHLFQMVEMANEDATVTLINLDVVELGRQKRLTIRVQQTIMVVTVNRPPETFGIVIHVIVFGLDHPVALFVDETHAVAVAQHQAQAVVEAIVVDAIGVGILFSEHRSALVIDKVKHPLLHHTGQAFGENPSLLVLWRNCHLSRKTVEVAAFVIFVVAGQAVAVRRDEDDLLGGNTHQVGSCGYDQILFEHDAAKIELKRKRKATKNE